MPRRPVLISKRFVKLLAGNFYIWHIGSRASYFHALIPP